MQTEFLNGNLLYALVFTLLHSLWQGALVFFVLKLVLLFVNTPKNRYTVGILSLCSLVVAVLFTFIYLLPINTATSVSLSSFELAIPEISTISERVAFNDRNYLNEIFLAWVMGVLFFLGRMLFGFYYVKNLINTASEVEWLEHFKVFKEKFSLTKQVRLGESAKVSSPITVGWLKPMILFPVGMLTGLSTTYLEAILAHELAHIKRNDYLINILQIFSEAIFFFNPFVWLISGSIRAEREFCCDELAAKFCNNKLAVANALVEVASYQKKIELAMHFSQKRNLLILRIKHILGMKKKKNYSFLVLVLALGLCGGCLYASSQNYSFGSSSFREESLHEERIDSLKKEVIELRNLVEEKAANTEKISDTTAVSLVLKADSLTEEAELLKLQEEVRDLRKKVEENSVVLPVIEIKRGSNNTEVLSKLKENQSNAVITNAHNFDEVESLSKSIDEKQSRISELSIKRMKAFESNVNNLLADINAKGIQNINEEFSIRFKENELLINKVPQDVSTTLLMKNLFAKHLRNEPVFEVGKLVDKNDIGIARTKYGFYMLLPTENNSTMYWPVKHLK